MSVGYSSGAASAPSAGAGCGSGDGDFLQPAPCLPAFALAAVHAIIESVARKTKAPRSSRAARAADQADFKMWLADAVAELQRKHNVNPASSHLEASVHPGPQAARRRGPSGGERVQ
jgi:membrane-bound lytic murein transglycosylase B